MSLNRKFMTLVVLGLLLSFLMVYLVTSPTHPLGTEKALKLVHKESHKRNTIGKVEIRPPPTTPTAHAALAEHVKSTCEKQQTMGRQGDSASVLHPDRYSHILVDDRYKMLYCYIPKVACTNWRRILLVLSGKVKVKNVLDISGGDVHGRYKRALPKLSDLSQEEIQYRLDNYFKFMFVREPFERLLSAWRNKFLNSANSHVWRQYRQKIVRRFGDPGLEKDEGKSQGSIGFEAFLQYIVDPLRTEALNEHWAMYFRLCLPCSVQYDFVGRYENLDEDAEHVLQSVHVDHVVHFPTRSASYKYNQTSSYLASVYRSVSAPLLRRVYGVYRKDFELFNYSLPSELRWIFEHEGKEDRR